MDTPDPYAQPPSATLAPAPMTINEWASSSENVNKAGYYLDGWYDLVENMGTKAAEVAHRAFEELQKRNQPDVQIHKTRGTTGIFGGQYRPYIIAATSPGVKTTMYINQYGNDLYVSWRTYIKAVLNVKNLIYMGLVAFVVACCCLIPYGIAISAANNINDNQSFNSSSNNDGINTGAIGRVALVCSAAVAVPVFFMELIFAAIFGLVFHRDPFRYFVVQPTIFDADDITAMSLGAHLSIEKALNTAGIDPRFLRPKNEFTGGYRGQKG